MGLTRLTQGILTEKTLCQNPYSAMNFHSQNSSHKTYRYISSMFNVRISERIFVVRLTPSESGWCPPPTQSQFNLTGTLKMCSLLLKEADYLI